MSKKIERIFVIYTDKDGTLTNTDNMFGKVSKSNKTLGDIQFHNKFKNNPFFDAALYGMLYVYNRTISYRKGASEVTNEWKDNYEVCIATRSPGTDSNTIFGELIRKDLQKTLEKKEIHYDKFVFADGYKEEEADADLPAVIIEDNPSTILRLRELGFRVIRINTPYNEFMKHKERDDYVTYVADSWEEVYEIVERIYKFEQWWILNKNLEKLKLYKQAQKEYIRERKKRS